MICKQIVLNFNICKQNDGCELIYYIFSANNTLLWRIMVSECCVAVFFAIYFFSYAVNVIYKVLIV